MIFDRLDGHEQVVFGSDPQSGLRCIVAIHSTALGPSLGGTRFYPYGSEADALADVLRLSQAMTYKSACAGIDHGGGKAVIIGDPHTDKSEPLLHAYGRLLAGLGGRYVTACDVGTYPADMEVIGRECRWVTGKERIHGGAGDSGVMTAYGVFVGMRAVADHLWGEQSLAGRRVVLHGVGKVGRALAGHLADDGAVLTVADVDAAAVAAVADRYGAAVCDPADVPDVDADILSPNALGGLLDTDTIPRLRVRAVCGGANNQLATATDGDRLRDRGILFAPDFVVNPGGVIAVADELGPGGYDDDRARRATERIGDTLRAVIALADEDDVSTAVAAVRLAQRRIAAATA